MSRIKIEDSIFQEKPGQESEITALVNATEQSEQSKLPELPVQLDTTSEQPKKIPITEEEAKKRSDNLGLLHKNSVEIHEKQHKNFVKVAEEYQKLTDELLNASAQVTELKTKLLGASNLRYLALVNTYNLYVQYAEFNADIRSQRIALYEQKLTHKEPDPG